MLTILRTCQSLSRAPRRASETAGRVSRISVILLATLLLEGCAQSSRQSTAQRDLSDQLSDAWLVGLSGTETLPLMAAQYQIEHPADGPMIVYIEGDGRAWQNPRKPSSDPTPIQPIGLALARAGAKAFNTAYIARPCQFAARNAGQCHSGVWTFGRYSQEAVDSMSKAIDDFPRSNRQKLVLVGYSGGGVMAALLAAQRTDVAALITVAANLDTQAWTSYHRVSHLYDSLNPITGASVLQEIPQRHFVGADDEIVPAAIVISYLEATTLSVHEHLIEVDDFDHHCCWAEHWRGLLAGALDQLNLGAPIKPTIAGGPV